MSDWAMLSIGLLLTVGTGLFVASEFALVNLDRHELETRAGRGERGLAAPIRALRITSTHLSSAQLGITLTTLLTGYTFEPAVSSLLSDPLEAAGVPEAAVPGIGAVTGVLLATLLSMVLGELVPKNFALAVPLATAKLVVPFQIAFTAVFRPMVLLLNNSANWFIRAFGVEPKEELSGARSAEELTYLVRHSATEGVLPQEEAALLDRTLRFTSHDAADVLTPRVRMTTVHRADTAARVLEVSAVSGYSRFPVIDRGPDDVVGFVHVKHAFAVPIPERSSTSVCDLMQPPVLVPEAMGADALLARLRGEGLQIAVVTDEYGGTAGLVTLEDLVEELIGELQDEHDLAHTDIIRSGRTVAFDAWLRPDELFDRAGIEIPDDGDWDTVGGFVAAELERVPELGDQVGVPGGSLRVERVDGAQVVRLRFIPAEPEHPHAVPDQEAGNE